MVANQNGGGALNPKDRTKNLLKNKFCDNCGANHVPAQTECPSPNRTCENWINWDVSWTVDIDTQVIKNLMEWLKQAEVEELYVSAGELMPSSIKISVKLR